MIKNAAEFKEVANQRSILVASNPRSPHAESYRQLLAELLDVEAACRRPMFLHGAAGDLAEAGDGQVSMIATDLLDYLGEALTALVRGRVEES